MFACICPGLAKRWSLIALASLILAACAHREPMPARPAAPRSQECLTLFERVDARVRRAGVQDAGFARVPGFPYLRVDRYSASFVDEVSNRETFWEWVAQLRANEDLARDVELRNLGLSRVERTELMFELRGCGSWLRSWELDDAAFRRVFLSRVAPIQAYSDTARALGLFPLARPFLQRGVERFHARVAEEFSRPLAELERKGELLLWRVRTGPEEPARHLNLQHSPRDRLGRVGLLWSDTLAMARHHAPRLWIDTAARYDLPGTPIHGPEGPDVDVSRPVAYFLPGLTRFGDRSLVQLNYIFWFSRRPAEGLFDPEAGALDALVWRVTLDDDGEPLFYDTIHACGCYHYGFPVGRLRRQEVESEHSILMPQGAVPTGPVALRLASGRHALQRVLPEARAHGTPERGYELRSYEELLTLPDGEGTRSLFGPDGLVRGTQRPERLWLWISGVRSPGAMRQWGHHVTSFTGDAYFDDPHLMEKLFVPPASVDGGVLASRPVRKNNSR